MDVIAAVLKDLYIFVVRYGFGFVRGDTFEQKSTKEIPREVLGKTDAERALTKKLLAEPEKPVLLQSPEKHIQLASGPRTMGYVCVRDANLWALPTKIFDGSIMSVPFASPLTIFNVQGTWMRVEYKGVSGWIPRDAVTERKLDIEPQLVMGTQYTAEDPLTVTLRARSTDAFSAEPLGLSLQNVEYVWYMLERTGRHIAWPLERPRIAGAWQRILKGVAGVHVGINPKNDAIFEYSNEEGTGHVALVRSVYPDQSLTLAEVGYEDEGVYGERTLTKEEWKELRPVFIEVA